MVRYLSWLANAALLMLGCFLVANTANAVFAALLTPSPAERAPAPAPEPPAGRSWNDREKILDRNLFNASLLAPAQQEEVDEDLQATQLPLDLLGTVASPNPRLSWAAIQDKEVNRHLVLRLRDDVRDGAATVTRIEPKRVVLSENGELRELVLAENTAAPPPPPKMSARKRPSRKSRAARRRSPRSRSVPRVPEPPSGLMEAIRTGADMQPHFEDGDMVGMRVSAVQAGSIFDETGIKDGDVITELNGIQLNSLEQSTSVLQELSEASELRVTIQGEEGPVTLTVPMPGR
jgi:general secretion pathway protein C